MGDPRLTPEQVSIGRACGAFAVMARSGSYTISATGVMPRQWAGRDVQIHVERPAGRAGRDVEMKGTDQ